jgi:ABC-type transport system involved in multi-copper enzyme maturation permease subunit
MFSKPLIGYILTAARRDKLIITLLLMIALGASLSVFLGSSAVIEQGQFSLVFGAGGLRFLGVMGIVLFVCFYIRRSFEHKEVEFMLSRPISRTTFLFSHAAAFILLAFLMALAVILPMLFVGVPSGSGLVVWGVSIAVEYAIVAVASLFFSMVLSSAAGSALATFGFYVLSRLIGMLLGIAALAPANLLFAILNKTLELISVVVPRLDLMGQTSWLVYGVDGSDGIGLLKDARPYAHFMTDHLGVMGFVSMQGILFIALLLSATTFDFVRRRF